MVVWAFYLIAIAMTALRNDGRLTLYAGALSLVQYGVLAWVLFATASGPEQLVSPDYGTAIPANQPARLIILLIMTLLPASTLHRLQRLAAVSGRGGRTGVPTRMWRRQH